MKSSFFLQKQGIISLVVAFIVLSAPAAVAQSASDVLQGLVDAHESRIASINDFTVTSEVGGSMAPFDRMITYYERVDEDGLSHFSARTRMEGGMADIFQGDVPSPMQNDPFLLNSLLVEYFGDTATHQGTETVDGHETHVIHIENMTELTRDLAEMQEGSYDESTEIRDVRFYIDTEMNVVRRITAKMSGEFDTAGTGAAERRTADMTFVLEDYREVDGLPYPFFMRMELSGIMSDQELAQLEQELEQMKAQLDQMPPAQREQIEQMMGGMEGMLSGSIDFEARAQDVAVNAGPPEGM